MASRMQQDKAGHLLVRLFWRRSSTKLRLHARIAAPPFSMCGRPSAAKCTLEWHTTGAMVTTTASPPALLDTLQAYYQLQTLS